MTSEWTGSAQLNMLLWAWQCFLCEVWFLHLGGLDSQQTVLIGCHLAARNEEEKQTKTSQFIVKEAAQILWNTGAFCEANRNTGPADCAETLLRFATHGLDAFNERKIVQRVKRQMTFIPNKKSSNVKDYWLIQCRESTLMAALWIKRVCCCCCWCTTAGAAGVYLHWGNVKDCVSPHIPSKSHNNEIKCRIRGGGPCDHKWSAQLSAMTQMGLFDDVMLYYPSDRIGDWYINLGAQHLGKLHLKKCTVHRLMCRFMDVCHKNPPRSSCT